jgi:hypothetical protein
VRCHRDCHGAGGWRRQFHTPGGGARRCNKKFEPRPQLSKADRAIPAYRRWLTQFGNADSVTYEEAVKAYVGDQLGFPVDAKLDW